MNYSPIARIVSLICFLAVPTLAQTTGNCTASNLNGNYNVTLNGRNISPAGAFMGVLQSNGIATFDGVGTVKMTGTLNTNAAQGQSFNYSGTYTVATSCIGSITLTQGSSASFSMVIWQGGRQYDLSGSDATYTYSGNGSNFRPVACAMPTLSGAYVYDASGTTLTGTALTGPADESGVLVFDGQGGVSSTSIISTSGGTPTQVNASGTYVVNANCTASAALKDNTGKTTNVNWLISGVYGESDGMILANSSFVRSGQSHAAFTNPTAAIANVASYAVNATPPGSVFVLFGQNTATKPAQASNVPLPTTLLNTTVTINGELAPLFYADTGQIDAQMPWDIPGNSLATVIVKNTGANGSTSNAAAVWVPAGAAPGISVYSNNHAVVVNRDNITVNSATAAAAVGDEVVAYFTGGGPVQAGKLTTGAVDPPNLQVTGANPTVTVGGMNATVVYMGLTSGGIGLYQANFIVPNLPKGSYPVVITIGGTASNSLGGPYPNPVMNISN